MSKRSPSEFQRDMEMRQRYIAFPGNLWKEARGWRGLITSKEPLSGLQVVGHLVLYLWVLGLLFAMGDMALTQFHNTSGTGVSRVVAGFGAYVIILALVGAVFLLLRWKIRKALASAHKRPPLAK